MNYKLYPFFIILAGFILISNSGNPPNGNTGAPGDGICTNCHGGSSGGLDGNVSITGLPTSLMANTKYVITVTVENLSTASKGGFQIVALDQNNTNAGTFSNPGGSSTIQTGGSRTYFEHNPAKSFGGPGTVTYTVDWTSPSISTGQMITMYGASILTNGSGNNSGDLLKTTETSGNMPGPAPLVASISAFKNVTCNGGSDGSITVTVTGGIPPYTYLWSDGQTTATAVGLDAKMHTVVVTDNAATMASSGKLLTEPPAISIASTGKKVLNCNGDKDGNLNVNSSGGTGTHSYKWNTGATTKQIFNLGANDYTVTVTDGSNCSVEQVITVTQPDIIDIKIKNVIKPMCFSDPSGSCEAEAMGGTGLLKYKWSSGETTVMIDEKKPGTYTVSVTDANNCVKSKSIVIETSDITKPVLSVQQDTFSYRCSYVAVAPKATDNCGVKELKQLEGTAVGDTFKTGITKMRFIAIDSSNNETELSYNVEIRNPIKLHVDTFLYDSCYGDINFIQFRMENISNFYYELLFNKLKISRYDTAFILSNKNHKFSDTLISLRDSFQCKVDTVLKFDTARADYLTLQNLSIKDASDCKISDGSIEIVINGKVKSFRWLDDKGNMINNQTGKDLAAGKYYYEASSGEPNDSTACLSTFGPFEVKCTTGSTEGILSKLSVYPNPAQDKLFIGNSNELDLHVEIYTSTGNKVKSLVSKASKVEIELNNLVEGFYFVEIKSNLNKRRTKIFIVR
ncbi:MAG: T9SS type A sorting domain-containing protein [Saprospiraceae bacterium]|nr:T9SS type A sorting domain-containing protein [Saprospiraceae bacterium]